MKKISLLIAAISLSAAMTSCSDFLTESSQDEIKPNNVSDYSELINGEIYNKFNNQAVHTYLDIMTDDCTEFAKKASFGADTRNAGNGYFTWQQSPELQVSGVLNDDGAWAEYYHHILIANMVLYDVDNLIGSDSEKAIVKAEAHMVRAYAYYMLVNLYGEPYDPATADKALGVPINNLLGAERKSFKRSSVAEVYEQILDDTNEALKLFTAGGGQKSTFRWNENAANLFIARVYLYMQNWEKAIEHVDNLLAVKANLWDLNEKINGGGDEAELYFLCSRNPEILFSFGYYYVNYFASGAKGAYPASPSLRAEYTSGDLRCGPTNAAYIRYLGSTLFGGGKRYCPYKFSDTSTGEHGRAFRTAEAYLIRAEAYSHTSQYTKALEDVNYLRSNRLTPAAFAAEGGKLTSGSQEEIIQMVRSERRREMCFEQLRWFDLRRWDRPSIEHTYTPDLTNTKVFFTYRLEQNDPAYTLPVPKRVLERDTELEDIKRPERAPIE